MDSQASAKISPGLSCQCDRFEQILAWGLTLSSSQLAERESAAVNQDLLPWVFGLFSKFFWSFLYEYYLYMKIFPFVCIIAWVQSCKKKRVYFSANLWLADFDSWHLWANIQKCGSLWQVLPSPPPLCHLSKCGLALTLVIIDSIEWVKTDLVQFGQNACNVELSEYPWI